MNKSEWIFLIFLQIAAIQALDCPHPASNLNTLVTSSSLNPGSVASYTCDHGYELFGSAARTCLDNGKWDGDIPICATDVAAGKLADQSSTALGGEASNANNGNATKCSQTNKESSPWWSLDLLQPYEVTRIKITTRGCCGDNVDPLQDLEIRIGDADQLQKNRLCNWVPGIIEEGSTKEIECVRAMVGRFVFIQMSGVHGSMSLCQVQVFSKDEFSKERCIAKDVERSRIGLFNQTCYEYQISSGGTFAHAQGYCKKRRRHGDLVNTISDLANTYIRSELARLEPEIETKMIWIGVQKEPQFISRIWRWIDGVKVERPSWGRDQPNNYNGEQNCVVLDGGRDWKWNDVGCNLNYLFWMCQFKPSCGSPNRSLNTTFAITSTNDKVMDIMTATYSCPEGNKVEGETHRSCLPNGHWNGSAPTCKYIDCGEPKPIDHGSVSLMNARTTYAAKASYSCEQNYTMQGENTTSCGDLSSWSPQPPKCLYSWCPELANPKNGRMTSDGSGSRAGDNVTFSCNSAHYLVGEESVTCKLGGKWTGEPPECKFVDCGQPESLEHGQLILVDNSTYFDSTSIYECDEDFYLEGLSSRRCESSGYWTGERPSCARIECGEPEIPIGGYVTGYSFYVHSSVEYHCEDGHYMTGDDKRTCQRNGQWSGIIPNCTFVDCGRLPPINKGDIRHVSKDGSTFLDSEALYTCNQNYRIIGNQHRICERNAEWSGITPTCQEIRCSEAEHPPKSRITISGNDRRISLTIRSRDILSGNRTYKVGSQVTYRCERGHAVSGSTIRTCLASGAWSATPPSCTYVNCGLPDQIPMGIYRLLSNETHYGAIASYECEPNWKINGKIRRYCHENSTWSTPIPECQEILCPSLSDELSKRYQLEDTQATESSWDVRFISKYKKTSKLRLEVDEGDRSIGSSAEYDCGKGKEVEGEDSRLCKQHGVWDGREPSCKWIFCSKPDEIVDGRMHVVSDSFIYGSVVEYFCLQKYYLNGPFNRTCTSNGTWSGQSPSCILNDYNMGVFGDNTIDGTVNLAHGPNRSFAQPSYTGIYVGIGVSLVLAIAVGLTLLFFKFRKSNANKTSSPPKTVDSNSTVIAYGDPTDSSAENNIYDSIPDDFKPPQYANVNFQNDSFSSSQSYNTKMDTDPSEFQRESSNNNKNNGRSSENGNKNSRNGNGVPLHISMRPRMPPPQPPVPSSAGVTINGITISGT